MDAGPDQGDNRVGGGINVAGGEAEQADAGVDKAVLASVVLGQSAPMGSTVVFDGEASGGVVEVRPAEESAGAIVDRNLGLGTRRPASTSSMRKRVSIGDSVAASAWSATFRNALMPQAPNELSSAAFNAAWLTSFACNAMSATTTASVRESRQLTSRSVRSMEVAGNPRLMTSSSLRSKDLLTTIPDRVVTPSAFGTVISIRSPGSTSRP